MPPDWAHAIESRESRGKTPRVEDFARTWSWIAALSNGWILTLAGAAGAVIVWRTGAIGWLRDGNDQCGDDDRSASSLPPGKQRAVLVRWAIGALVILLVALAVRWPRMDLSLYYDEGYSLLRYIEGDFKRNADTNPDDTTSLTFRKVTWTHTFFGNRHGNNNVFQSILSRLCNDLWKPVSGAVEGEVREWPLRLPSLVFGLASIGVLGRLLLVVAPPWVSWLGMTWAALHPWHLRYSTEARGYGIAFFFMLAGIGALVRAIESNRLRWWTAFLLCEAGCLYAFPGAASFALALNGTAVLWLIFQWRKKEGRGFGFLRSRFLALTLANAGAAVIFWQLMAPCLPQLRQAVATFWSMGGGPEAGWWTDLPFYLIYGRPWIETYSDPAAAASLAIESTSPAPFRWLMIDGILGTAVIAGIGCWAGRDKLLTWLMGGALLAAPIAYLVSSITDSVLQKWYVVYLVSPVIFLAVLGCGWLVKRWRIPGAVAAGATLVLLVAGSTGPFLRYEVSGKEQLKDVVVAARGEIHPFRNEEALPILAAVWSWSVRLYDPHLRIIETEKDLDRLIAEASRSGRSLAVTVGESEQARAHHPEVLRRLESSGEFEPGVLFPGLEHEKFAQKLFRWRTAPPKPDRQP